MTKFRYACLILLFLIASQIVSPCSPIPQGYIKKFGFVFYNFGETLTLVKGTTAIGFEYVKHEKGAFANQYGKNKRYVFYLGNKIPKANPKTFKILGGTYSVVGIDGYAIDDKYAYYEGRRMDSVDMATFEPFFSCEEGFAKDKNHVYNKGVILEGMDANTFKMLEKGYLADKSGIYYIGHYSLEGIQESPLLLNSTTDDYKQYEYFIVSNNSVYCGRLAIEGIDADSFEVLHQYISHDSCGYESFVGALVKDKNGVYFTRGRIIKHFTELDPLTIEKNDKQTNSYSAPLFFRDKNGLYALQINYNNNSIELEKITKKEMEIWLR